MPQALPVIGAIATVGGTIASVSAQRSASRAQQRQETLSTRRSQRAAVREAQIRRAQTLASAQGFGALDGSGVAGGTSSLSSQLGEALGFSTQMSGISHQINKYRTQADFWGGVSNLGGSLFNMGLALNKGNSNPPPNRPPQTAF